MLCLNRKLGQGIKINDDVTVTIIDIRRQTVRLGIVYSEKSRVLREEVYLKIQAENKEAALSATQLQEALGKVLKKKIAAG